MTQDTKFFVQTPDSEFQPPILQIVIWKGFIFLTVAIAAFVLISAIRIATVELLYVAGYTDFRLFTADDIAFWVSFPLSIFVALLFWRTTIIVPAPYHLVTLIFASVKKHRKSGYHVLIPIFEKTVTYVDTRSQPIAITETRTFSANNIPVICDVNLRVRIDPSKMLKVVFEIDSLFETIRQAVEGSLQEATAETTISIDESGIKSGEIATLLEELMAMQAVAIGIVIDYIKKSDFIIDEPSIKQALIQVTEAELIGKGNIKLSEAEDKVIANFRHSLGSLADSMTNTELWEAIQFLKRQQTFGKISARGMIPLTDLTGEINQ